MAARGFQPDFPPETKQQLADISAHPPQLAPSSTVHDLRNLLWSSIDNDTSKDLDQMKSPNACPTAT
jgi:exoribonuclease-2